MFGVFLEGGCGEGGVGRWASGKYKVPIFFFVPLFLESGEVGGGIGSLFCICFLGTRVVLS